MAEFAAKERRDSAPPAHGIVTAQGFRQKLHVQRPTANWQPKALPTKGMEVRCSTARSQRSGPVDRSHTSLTRHYSFPIAELRRVFARK